MLLLLVFALIAWLLDVFRLVLLVRIDELETVNREELLWLVCLEFAVIKLVSFIVVVVFVVGKVVFVFVIVEDDVEEDVETKEVVEFKI